MAARSGIPFDTYAKYESGAAAPGAKALAALSRAGVNVQLVLLGDEAREGNVAGRWPSAGRGEISSPALGVAEPKADYVYLPLIDVSAAAGGGAIVGEGEHAVDALAFKADWIRRELHVAPEDLRLIYVEGDSMEPDLRAGDIILVDHTDTLARREGIYVIRMDGALLVKQLQRLPGGAVKVISRNPTYEPFTIPTVKIEEPNGFAVLGRVVWACRRF
jgi:phage repressor protein C with HTH and peptisase S24 domain